MSIRNKDLVDIITSCKYYENDIKRDSYIPSWSIATKKNFDNRGCVRLLRRRLTDNPIIRADPTDTIFSYKTEQPKSRDNKLNTNIIEFFGKEKNNNLCLILIIILITITFFY